MKSLDMQENAARNQSALEIAGLNESGANSRALLNAGLQGEQNQIARDRLVGEMDLNKTRLAGDLDLNKARIGSEVIGQKKGQMELDSMASVQSARDEYLRNPTPENELKYRLIS